MTTDDHLIGFIIAATLTSMIIMGGVTMVYFLDKHRSARRHDKPNSGRSAPRASHEGSRSVGPRLDRAASDDPEPALSQIHD